MEIIEIENKSTEEIQNMFQNIKDGQALRVETKTGFIIGVGGLVHKLQDGILYIATKKGWVVL